MSIFCPTPYHPHRQKQPLLLPPIISGVAQKAWPASASEGSGLVLRRQEDKVNSRIQVETLETELGFSLVAGLQRWSAFHFTYSTCSCVFEKRSIYSGPKNIFYYLLIFIFYYLFVWVFRQHVSMYHVCAVPEVARRVH